MYRKIMLLICLFCFSFSFKVNAEKFYIGNNQNRTDYTAYMNVSIPENSTASAMLLFRAKNIELFGYGLSYYEVGFETDSKIVFRKYYTGYYSTHTVTLETVKVDNDGKNKTIAVDAVGNSFKIYLDGEVIIDYTDKGSYNTAVRIIPVLLNGDVGYRLNGDAKIIDYGSTDYETLDSHIKSVTITDSEGNVIGDGSYVPPETELNYSIDFTEDYDGVSVVAVEDGEGNLLESNVEGVSGDGRTGKVISPMGRKYFRLVEYAWETLEGMKPVYAKGSAAEFNSKEINDFYDKDAIVEKEIYTVDKEHFMSGPSTAGVNISFSDKSSLLDVAGIVLSSTKESQLHNINCYRAVIRNKNTILLEKVHEGITTVLQEVSIEPISNGEKHNLKLHIYGSRISIYYDDEKIIKYTVPDIFYVAGYPGTYVYGNGIEISDMVFSNWYNGGLLWKRKYWFWWL